MFDITWLKEVILGQKSLTALVAFILYAIILGPLTKLIEIIILKLTHRTKTKLDDIIIKKLYKWVFYLLFLIGTKYAFIYSGVLLKYADKLILILDSLLILVLFYALYVFIDVFIAYGGKKFASKTKSTMDDSLIPLIEKFTKWFFIIIAFLIIFSKWGIDIGAVLAGLGIAGIAIGFAVKDSLANIFGGISLILDKNFKVGDKIKIDSGDVGVIEDIGLRSTKLKDYDNHLIIVPNGKLANSKIINYVKPDPKLKFKIDFAVEYGVDVDKVKKIILKVLEGISSVVDEPAPSVLFKEMGDSALIFSARAWVENYGDAFMTKEESTCEIYKALNKAKINIPYPQMDVHVKKR